MYDNEYVLHDDDPDEDPEIRQMTKQREKVLEHWKQRHDQWVREQWAEGKDTRG